MIRIMYLLIPLFLFGISGGAMAGPATEPADAAATQQQPENGELVEKVKETLESDKRLERSKIRPNVDREGNVSLNGTVATLEQVEIAEELVASIEGVNQVRNYLRPEQ